VREYQRTDTDALRHAILNPRVDADDREDREDDGLEQDRDEYQLIRGAVLLDHEIRKVRVCPSANATVGAMRNGARCGRASERQTRETRDTLRYLRHDVLKPIPAARPNGRLPNTPTHMVPIQAVTAVAVATLSYTHATSRRDRSVSGSVSQATSERRASERDLVRTDGIPDSERIRGLTKRM